MPKAALAVENPASALPTWDLAIQISVFVLQIPVPAIPEQTPWPVKRLTLLQALKFASVGACRDHSVAASYEAAIVRSGQTFSRQPLSQVSAGNADPAAKRRLAAKSDH